MEATIKYVDGLRFVADGSTGHSIVMDGDPEFGGEDTAPRPTELVLMGLGGCTGMDVISILRKKRQEVTGFEIEVRGKRAEAHPKKFTDINLHYTVRGRDISEDAVKKAVTLSMERYCSVKATLEGVANITYSYSVIQE
ncbi:MAG TPA: OsmC family protein [Nitrospirae bacterium]|nr:OsmC family protein [Nitrospirota bacterium]